MTEGRGTASAEAVAFLRRYVNSVELFEVLLFLFGRKEEIWTAEQVSSELRSSAVSIERRLADLCELGLAVRQEGEPPHFRFRAADARVAAVLSELAELYQSHRYTVIDMIFSKPLRDVETFADAFRIRGRDKDG